MGLFLLRPERLSSQIFLGVSSHTNHINIATEKQIFVSRNKMQNLDSATVLRELQFKSKCLVGFCHIDTLNLCCNKTKIVGYYQLIKSFCKLFLKTYFYNPSHLTHILFPFLFSLFFFKLSMLLCPVVNLDFNA